MAEENSTPEERTEMPTERRMGELRKKGALHMSTDVVQVVTLMSGFVVLSLAWKPLYEGMKLVLTKSFRLIAEREPLTSLELLGGFKWLLLLLGPPLILIILITALMGSLAVMLQTNWNIKEKKIDIDFSRLNPIGGLRRIFSLQGLITTLKAVLKLVLILPIAYFVLKAFAPQMIMVAHQGADQILTFSAIGMQRLFWRICCVLAAFAVFDWVWGRYQWLKHNKMTKQEVKDERKSLEGDEETRRRIQAKGLQRIAQRIRQSVPKADVVVTNPTHVAVALRYDRSKMDAPMVVAKGRGFLAERIKEIARAAGVPVLERKTLARALYESVEVGAIIPRELFRAVAEVLAYVYRLKNPWAYASAGQ